MSKISFCLISFILIMGLSNSAWAYDWSIGVQNQINYSEFTLSLYDPPGPPAVWAGDDNLWEEIAPGDSRLNVKALKKKNSEYTSGAGALGLSLAVPNGDYEIFMSRVFFHGAKSEGGGFAEIEITAEDKYLSDLFWNDALENIRDLELFAGSSKITVTDGSLDLVVGQCRTTRARQGRSHWFSFEGFKLTRVAAPDPVLPDNPGPATVADYLAIDDTESYGEVTSISDSWKDGSDSSSGSAVSLDTEKGRKGKQAIKFAYNNSVGGSVPNYSEIKANVGDLGITSDWAGAGLKALDLWFRGTAGNSAEQMYLAVEDTAGHITTVPYDGPADYLTEDRWHLWQIDLQQLSALNLNSVAGIYIGVGDRDNPQTGGSGVVYFDDIRLYRTRSVGKPGTSLNDDGNSRIDLADLASLTDQLLKTPSQFTAAEMVKIRYLRSLFQSSKDSSYPIPLSYEIALSFEELGKYSQAKTVYQRIQQRPGHSYGSVLQLDILRTDILSDVDNGNDSVVLTAIDNVIGQCNNAVSLSSQTFHASKDCYSELVFVVGAKYCRKALEYHNQDNQTQANAYFAKAITIWEKIIQQLPASNTTPTAYYFAADAHRNLGQYQEAIDYYQQIVDNHPDYEFAWNSQFMIGRNYEKLAKAGLISKSQAEHHQSRQYLSPKPAHRFWHQSQDKSVQPTSSFFGDFHATASEHCVIYEVNC